MKEQFTFIQIKDMSEEWCDEAGMSRHDNWHYPFQPDQVMSVTQVLWRLVDEGRCQTTRGLRAYFDRFIDAVNAR